MFSFIGYTAKIVAVGNQSIINASLSSDVSTLSEVIVTGYGSQSKRDITGAVTTVNAQDLKAVPATTFAQQLQGRASGLNVVNDATPGGNATVSIRGFGTIGNNDPLFIIDGVPTENSGNLNPNDIETIQILKDASSASIYGSRAANGVVIITTKQGKPGKPVITFNAYYGTQAVANNVQVLNAKELGQYLYLADLGAGKTPAHGQYTYGPNGEVTIPDYVFPSRGQAGTPEVDPARYSLQPGNIYAITKSADTDWWKQLTQSSPIQNYQVGASGGTENGRYSLSLGYFSQQGVVKFIGYDRFTIRANTEFSALNKKLKIGENFSISFDNRKGGFDNNDEQNAVAGSYKHHPLLPIYDIAGNFAGSRGANLGNNSNPYATLSRQQDNRTLRLRIFGNAYTSYDIIPNLTVKTSLGIDGTSQRGRYLGRSNPEYVEGSFVNSSTATDEYSYQWVWTNTLSYSKQFGTDHQFDAYVGTEAIREFKESFGASRQGFAFEIPSILSYLSLGDATKASNYGGVDRDYTLFSYFGKANYAYKDRYLAQFILRNDASSRFLNAPQNAIFLAYSLGWRNLSSNNYHIMRYDMILLWLAECEVEVGSLEKARELVNQVRARAANPAGFIKKATQGPALRDDYSVTNEPAANYVIKPYTSFASKEYGRKAVRFETRLEFGMEGHRLFDLVRWRVAAPVLNEYLRVEQTKRLYLKGATFTKGKNEYFPIPQNAIDRSLVGGTATLKQDASY